MSIIYAERLAEIHLNFLTIKNKVLIIEQKSIPRKWYPNALKFSEEGS